MEVDVNATHDIFRFNSRFCFVCSRFSLVSLLTLVDLFVLTFPIRWLVPRKKKNADRSSSDDFHICVRARARWTRVYQIRTHTDRHIHTYAYIRAYIQGRKIYDINARVRSMAHAKNNTRTKT